MVESSPLQSENTPTPKQRTEYFQRLGIRLRGPLKALQAFKVFGEEAKTVEKQKQWFIGYRAVVETALALKIADLVRMPENEQKLLVQASMTHHATKRRQYEAKAHGVEITSDTYDEIQKSGRDELIALGIDPQAIEIGLSVGSSFKGKVERGEIQPKNETEEMIFRLQRYMAYIENCVDQHINFKEHSQSTDIVDWRQRIDESQERYSDITAEEFDTERRITGQIETELRAALVTGGQHIEESMPLWKFLREEIAKDIRAGKVPKVPTV